MRNSLKQWSLYIQGVTILNVFQPVNRQSREEEEERDLHGNCAAVEEGEARPGRPAARPQFLPAHEGKGHPITWSSFLQTNSHRLITLALQAFSAPVT